MRRPRPAAVLFDLDGTLLDTAPDFFRLLNQMLAERRQPELDQTKVRQQISNGAAAMIQSAFNIDAGDPQAESLRAQFLERYRQNPAQESRLFAGMDRLLLWLDQQQIPWGIVTNKPEHFCRPLLQQLQLANRCSTLICPEHVTQGKPHPEGLLKACAELRRHPQQCLYVGDHRRDIEAGINAGMTTITALYGYLADTDQADDWHADQQIEHPQQLLDWLQACD
ncbi:MAG: 2-phosphoglycolate phosphatase [Motiliproteus sp.]|jgi:2-phosphoglycolate phosphatase